MSDTLTHPDEAAQRARDLIDAEVNARVDAVRVLAEAARDADAAEARARETAAAHEQAWQAALKAGWNEKSLRATGVRAPGAGRRGRRTSGDKNTD